ncbi:MAG: hypothetical protein JWQ21_754 [Herminiimonas sp.]|nr:hypothetical protein [Herminiimonas sp.]
MKITKFAAASAIATTALLLQSAVFATQPSASGGGAILARSTVSGNFAAGANGMSASYAKNSEAATAKLTATANYTPHYRTVNAGIAGATTTDSSGTAYNVSTGSGTGSAMSAGSANTRVQGVAAIRGVSKGFNGGYSSTQTDNAIEAGANQGSYVAGQTRSGFDTQLHYAKSSMAAPGPAGSAGGTRSSTAGISAQATGYANGTNVTKTLDGMNAAGIAGIGASGKFFAKADLSASAGPIAAP